MSAKLEINFRSLIVHCEEMVKDDNQKWRLNKYIKNLDIMLQELSDYDTLNKNKLEEYIARCWELKQAANYVEPTADDRENRLKNKFKSNIPNDSIIKEIKQLNNSKYSSELRKELFDGDDSTGLRRRGQNESSENLEKYYFNIQEKLAEEMISMTRNLKDQTLAANKIIKKDTETIGKSSKISAENSGSLESESNKLQEHSKRAWKCWMWVMISLVMMIFIFMVLFMKLMKKKT